MFIRSACMRTIGITSLATPAPRPTTARFETPFGRSERNGTFKSRGTLWFFRSCTYQ